MSRRAATTGGGPPAPAASRIADAIGGDIDPGIVSAGAARALIEGRCRELGIDADRFADLLVADRAECAALRRRLVPAETWFFRYPASFEHLRHSASSRHDARPWRIASLGCATGAEPYSVAIALEGVVTANIVAVDRDAAALESARCGRLGAGSIRGAIPPWARGALLVEERAVVVAPRWRERVEFIESDLFDPALPRRIGGVDALFCRNVAIYLGERARRDLGTLISALLAPGGWLYLGHAESASTLGLDWSERDSRAFAVRAPLRDSARGSSGAADRHGAARPRTRTPPGAAPPSRRTTPASVKPSAAPTSAARGAGAASGDSSGSVEAIDSIRRLADEGRHDEARAGALALHERGERGADLLELLGTLSLVDGRTDDAERFLRAALYMDPDREAAAIQLALITESRRG